MRDCDRPTPDVVCYTCVPRSERLWSRPRQMLFFRGEKESYAVQRKSMERKSNALCNRYFPLTVVAIIFMIPVIKCMGILFFVPVLLA